MNRRRFFTVGAAAAAAPVVVSAVAPACVDPFLLGFDIKHKVPRVVPPNFCYYRGEKFAVAFSKITASEMVEGVNKLACPDVGLRAKFEAHEERT